MRRLALSLAALAAAAAFSGSASAQPDHRVAGLQVALYRYGHYAGPIDGIAGPQTKAAIRKLQRSAGLKPDGVAGKETRAALGRYGRPGFGSRVLKRGMVGFDVSVLQFLLAKRGFPPKALNSKFGHLTEALVRRFQRKLGLTVDGVVGRETRAALLLGTRPPKPRAERERTLAATRSSVTAAINHWARHYGVDPRLARALAWQESGFQPHVRSVVGARGVMQVTEATRDFVEVVLIGRRVPRTVDGNIRVGVAYLAHLLREFRGNVRRAVGAYYQGPAAVRKAGLFPETRRFVANVLALRGRV